MSNMSAICDPIPIQSNYLQINSDTISNVNTSMPIAITPKKGSPNTHIGTCRSYDETQVVPSFGRFLGNESPSRSKKSAKKLFGESPKQ